MRTIFDRDVEHYFVTPEGNEGWFFNHNFWKWARAMFGERAYFEADDGHKAAWRSGFIAGFDERAKLLNKENTNEPRSLPRP